MKLTCGNGSQWCLVVGVGGLRPSDLTTLHRGRRPALPGHWARPRHLLWPQPPASPSVLPLGPWVWSSGSPMDSISCRLLGLGCLRWGGHSTRWRGPISQVPGSVTVTTASFPGSMPPRPGNGTPGWATLEAWPPSRGGPREQGPFLPPQAHLLGTPRQHPHGLCLLLFPEVLLSHNPPTVEGLLT